jgi:putative cardiolipin synthase
MGMLKTLVGSRVPEKYRKYLNLPPRKDSWKMEDTSDTGLGRTAVAWLTARHGKCGVLRLSLGLDALSVRIGLIDAAEKCIDIQSYLIKDDLSGNLIGLKLIEAADRGVRVRLLMDDALTEEIDTGLVSINDHVNIEVRVFNPFPRRRSRFISLIANFNILNRRMHNKSFTVDNQVTIVGGRNIADEYFQTSDKNEFFDEDLLAIGPVVDAVSEGFDEYWNMLEAIPIDGFDSPIEHPPIAETIKSGHLFLDANKDSPFLSNINDRLTRELLSGELALVESDAHLVLDHPDKVRGLTRNQTGETSEFLRQLVSSAKTEVFIVSPYFVPQRQGVEFLTALVRKGVRVVVITNSLASTNHSSVHAVYARYRKPLLRQGVELFELRPRLNIEDRSGNGDPNLKTTLHAKLSIVDRETLFVGSFNLDPRSLYINTEMGMAVESPELASSVATQLGNSLQRQAYGLRLSRSGAVRWKYFTPNGEQIAKKEPHTTIIRRTLTRLMSLLPIEGQM